MHNFLYSFTKKIKLSKSTKKTSSGNKFDKDGEKILELKPDISCGIIDLKYDKNSIKILEFGEIEFSAFKGHEALYGQGKIWGQLWKYLAQFKKPIWYVSSKGSSRSNDKAIDVLYKVGGLRKKSFEDLEKDPGFKNLCESFNKQDKNIEPNESEFSEKQDYIYKNYISKDFGSKDFGSKDLILKDKEEFEGNEEKFLTKISDYLGIIVVKNRSKRKDSVNNTENFKKFIILNEKFTKYGENKHNCASLFEDKKLENFKPKWRAYQFEYKPNLAEKIISDFADSKKTISKPEPLPDTFVVKPVNSTRGQGIIIVEKENLDEVLKKILHKSSKQVLSDEEKYLDGDYAFWQNYKESVFLIETFEKSKTIVVNKKEYDATMRIVFVMDFQESIISFNIIGAYWKLPSCNLKDKCSLTEKHKSNIGLNGVSSAKVSDEDINDIGKMLEKIIPEIYSKILE